MTWIKYPSQSEDSSTSVEDIIFSQDVTSRLMHGYIAFFVPTGLLAGIIILGIFIKNYRHHALNKLDILIFAHTISNILMILLSLSIIVRPAYLRVSYFKCAVLSFFFNFSYFSSQYFLILMALSFLLNRHPPQRALISKANKNPTVCVVFALICAFCAALIVVALLGIENYHEETDCQLDPLFAWPEYEIIKFAFGFSIPSLAKILCFILSFVKKIKTETHSSRQNIHPYLTVLVIGTSMFICRLFYNIMILFRTNLKIQRSIGTPQNELTMNIAEVLLFGESCVSFVVILCLHKPCRDGFLNILTNLTKLCRRHDNNRSLETHESHNEVSFVPSENGSHWLLLLKILAWKKTSSYHICHYKEPGEIKGLKAFFILQLAYRKTNILQHVWTARIIRTAIFNCSHRMSIFCFSEQNNGQQYGKADGMFSIKIHLFLYHILT